MVAEIVNFLAEGRNISKQILETVGRRIKLLPEGAKMTKPSVFPIGEEGRQIGYIVDKSAGKVKVKIQDSLNTAENWGKGDRDTLNCVFDSKGQMVEGELTWTSTYRDGKATYGDSKLFRRGPRGDREIVTREGTFKPNPNTDAWVRTTLNETPPYSGPCNVLETTILDDSALGQVFGYLTKKDASILG